MPDLTPPGPPSRARAARAPGSPAGTRSIIVTSNFPPVVGGSCQVYANIAEQGRGLVSVLTARRSFHTGEIIDGAPEFDRLAPYAIHRIDLLRPSSYPGRLASLCHDTSVMVRLLAVLGFLCLRDRISVVCIGDLVYAGWLAWPLRHILRRRVVFYVHGEEMSESAGGRFERWKGAFLRTAHAVLAVSSFARDLATSVLGANPARVHLVPNGVDLSIFRQRPRAHDLAIRFGLGQAPVLLTVSRLVERKGLDTVLRALPRIAAAVPDIRYLVVGDGPDRGRLEALARTLNLQDRVTFTGRMSAHDLPRAYTLGDVFVMPNRRLPSGDTEGFGLVFLEANASGLPVVAGRAGGTADAVVDGQTGIVVDGMDAGAVAEAVLGILRDPARRTAMAGSALAFAASSSWADRFALYQRAIDTAGQPRPAPAPTPLPFVATPPANRPVASLPRPTLLVVIDAEEQFDWQTYMADATDVSNMRHLAATGAIYARHGIQPTYMIDYPVATQPDGYEPLRALLAANDCTVGAQLHPWVNPPFRQRVVSPVHSFPGNLPEADERAKLTELTTAIEHHLGVRPRAYRAGRYGFGPNTRSILRDLGYTIDCSVLPFTDLTANHGPNYAAWHTDPAWLDPASRLLEVPVTTGIVGRWATSPAGPALLASRAMRRIHLPGILARAGLLERIKLTPEGTSLDEAKRLTRTLIDRGQRVFVITYHSSSLVPGHAPYVRTPADLDRFLAWIDGYCAWFMADLAGQPGTLDGIHQHAVETLQAA